MRNLLTATCATSLSSRYTYEWLWILSPQLETLEGKTDGFLTSDRLLTSAGKNRAVLHLVFLGAWLASREAHDTRRHGAGHNAPSFDRTQKVATDLQTENAYSMPCEA